MSTAHEYEAQIRSMVSRGQAFLRENPGFKASIQFNFPSGVMMIGTISQGLENHLISADAGGLQLIEAVSAGDDPEATIVMLRITISALNESGW